MRKQCAPESVFHPDLSLPWSPGSSAEIQSEGLHLSTGGKEKTSKLQAALGKLCPSKFEKCRAATIHHIFKGILAFV